MHEDGVVTRGVLFDPTGAYRYRLWRVWAPDAPRLAFVLLNPNAADAVHDDPTIRRCVGFARAWGYGGVDVVNLFAWRTPNPRALRAAPDPVGPDNDAHLQAVAARAALVVAGWGVHGALAGRDVVVRRLLAGYPLACLGLTKAGHPRHPLYLPCACTVVDF